MAKYEKNLTGSFDRLLDALDRGLMNSSISASLEDSSSYTNGSVRCTVRVYERYSWTGGNRVSMNITLVGDGDNLFASVITSGGSQGIFFKINTLGEESFLRCATDIIEGFR